jgi:LytR cell envelope-related transcriptional attenuator
VEHALSLSVSRWRAAALGFSVLAALELVVLGAIGFKALAKTVSHDVQTAALNKVAGPQPVTHHAAPGRPTLPRGETGVLVLNGNGIAGAAAAGAEQVRGRGYVVTGVGNAQTEGQTQTLVMYRGKFRPEALRLAHDVHAKLVTPLDGMRTSQLMGAQLVLVLGG